LRALVAAKAIDAVILYASDRWHRNLVNQVLMRQEFQRAGIAIHYVNRGPLYDTPEARFTDNIDAAVAEYERERIRERTMRGTRGKVEAGKLPGGGLPPYGYRYVGERQDRTLEIIPEQAAIVREIHERYQSGEGVGIITRDLSARQVPTWSDLYRPSRKQRAPGQWDQGTVYDILNDPTYAGTFYAFRRGARDKKMFHRDRSEWIGVPCPAIIDPALFNANQQRLATGQKLSKRNIRRFYLLRGHIHCGRCGAALIGATVVRPSGRENKYYKCNNAHIRAVERCHLPYPSADDVDAVVWADLKDMLPDCARLEASLQRLRERAAQGDSRRANQRADLERRLASVQRDIDRYLQLFGRAGIEPADLERQLTPLNTQRADIRRQLAALEPTGAPDPRVTRLETLLHTDYADVLSGLAHAEDDPEARRRLIELLGTAVTVDYLDGHFVVTIDDSLTDTPRSYDLLRED
jgi:site-specific DNA recombinase